MFPFTKGKKNYSLYHGGAHGVIGVLYELLCAIKLFKDKFTQVQIDIIKSSLDFVSTLQFETGNFPSSVTGGSDTKVHFCHGPIGAIHLYGHIHSSVAPLGQARMFNMSVEKNNYEPVSIEEIIESRDKRIVGR